VRQTETGGQILEVGTLDSLKPWLDRHPHKIEDRFADKVLLPDFIDPHLHPSMAAVICPCTSSPRWHGTCRGKKYRPPKPMRLISRG
jgi:predicted amidohydrolase YtcJ